MLKINTTILHKTYLHNSCIINAQPANVMRKIMGQTKKKKFYESNQNPVLPIISNNFGKSPIETKITGNSRRSNMLNKIFMKHVTDIMATGEYSSEISGLGIEINKVKVSPDYKFLNVYWMGSDASKYDEIEKLLKKNAGYLRHELATLRVIGNIPNIVFVKDKSYDKVAQVQERLAIADFGEDYEPRSISEEYKTEFELLAVLDHATKNKVEEFELTSSHEIANEYISELPPMPQNVLGLDHARIMKKIKKGINTSRATHRTIKPTEWAEWSEFKNSQLTNEDPVKFSNSQEQRKAFKNFLKQRQLLRCNNIDVDKNWTFDREYTKEILRERYEKSMQFEEALEEEDYITEESEHL
ncbi:hypothetical protein ABEB36_002699 [Hypothenemus hampei]|uniref:Ribosome-binding factor A, mitochondrial n=1 Tax=Hypothenemus hampei TaxID=57062 RepID=A0ABD1F6Q6_HYPHA